ncbi:hypothetical protein [Marinobacter nauticus]|uniref:hypothetical protein n=1 Tax=Marinobacter nauticus TaxID=2743 RepID=UPI000EB2B6A5|nr:hypothetical protein [Marinobacter nauticus]RKR72100.1 hypothetical protein C7436_2459 [Marinobacter nauticus]
MKISLGVLIVLTLVVLGARLMDVATDRAKIVEFSAPVSAYTDWECGYPNQSGCSVVFELNANAEYDVQRIRYGKDFMAIKIQKGGVDGWVFSSPAVRVHAGPST